MEIRPLPHVDFVIGAKIELDGSSFKTKSSPKTRMGHSRSLKAVVEPAPSLPPQVTAVVRRVLEAVHRSNGRLGKTLIAQFLVGSENAKLQRLRLDRLPHYAALKPLKQAEANLLLDNMLTAGLLEQKAQNRIGRPCGYQL